MNFSQKGRLRQKPFSEIMILVTVIFMDLLTGMEFDLFVPAFPQLQNHFSLSAFWVEALLSVNFIGCCIGMIITGGLADHYGRKPIILLGLLIFIIGSILCLIQGPFTLLLFGRFLQGVGIASPITLSFLIIADRYPIKKQQFLMAMLNGSIHVATCLAPVIGSYITLYFHWQANFIALLLLGVIVLIMTFFFIPTYATPAKSKTNLFSGYKVIIQSKPLVLLASSIVLMLLPYWIFVGMAPLLYIEAFNVSLSAFGFYQGALAFTFAIGTITFGLMIYRKSQKLWLYMSAAIFIMAFLVMVVLTLTNSSSPILITLAMLIFVIGQVIPIVILYPLCLNFIPSAKARISAALQIGRLVIAALSLEVAGYFYNGSFQSVGIILALFIFMIITTLYPVIRNKSIMNE